MSWTILKQRSYAPYTSKKKCCVIEGKTKKIYPGIKIENQIPSLSIDEISGALYNCLSENDKPYRLVIPPNTKLSPYQTALIDNYKLSIDYTENMPMITHNPFLELIHNLQNTFHCHNINSKNTVAALFINSSQIAFGINITSSNMFINMCAERVLLHKILSYGHALKETLHLYNPHVDFISPCGACRHVLYEHIPKMKITLHHRNNMQSSHFIHDLYPFASY